MRFTALLLAVVVAGCDSGMEQAVNTSPTAPSRPREVREPELPIREFDREGMIQVSLTWQENHVTAPRELDRYQWRISASVASIINAELVRLEPMFQYGEEVYVRLVPGEVEKLKVGQKVVVLARFDRAETTIPPYSFHFYNGRLMD